MEAMAAIVAGAATFLFFAYLARSYALRPQEARLRAITERPQVTMTRGEDGVALLKRGPSRAVVSRWLNTTRYADRWQFELERADLKLKPSEYFLIRLVMGALTVLIVTLVGRSAIAFIVGLPLGAMVYMLPAYWVRFRTQRRIHAIDGQLSETVTLIAGALRAGFAFSQGIDVAAKRMGPPISVELGRVLLDVNLGMAMEDALMGMNERIGSDDVDMVVTAILIQRQSGGNLAEVLESVTETIRERERIRGEIKTLTASQRFTAWVLSIWPAVLGGVFFLINPEMTSLMWTTSTGVFLLGLWFVLNLLGVVSLQRILNIDI